MLKSLRPDATLYIALCDREPTDAACGFSSLLSPLPKIHASTSVKLQCRVSEFSDSPPSTTPLTRTRAMTTPGTGPTARTLWRPVLLVWLILLTLGFGITVAMTPQTRIYEDIICRQYYADHPEQSTRLGIPFSPSSSQQQPQSRPDESLCKKPAIQDAINSLFGWQMFFDGIPGLLLAMYYGSLADTWGRRPVLILSLVGQLLGAAWILLICWVEADVRLTWLSSIFSCIGGGNTVFTAAAMMILADAAPDAVRTRIFFYASTCLVVGEMVGPPVGAALMARDPWIPNMIGFLCMGLATALAFLMNETLLESGGSAATTRPPPEATPPRESSNNNTGYLSTLTSGLKTVLHHATSTLRFVAHDRNLILLVGAYFTVDFARETLSLLVRYVSVRFSVPLAQASYLLSFRASGHLLASAVLLPVFDALLARRFRAAPMKKDLVMARVSIGFVTTGFAGLVLAPGVVAVCVGEFDLPPFSPVFLAHQVPADSLSSCRNLHSWVRVPSRDQVYPRCDGRQVRARHRLYTAVSHGHCRGPVCGANRCSHHEARSEDGRFVEGAAVHVCARMLYHVNVCARICQTKESCRSRTGRG